MSLRHGFKADAGRIASELRSAMGLSEIDRFDPFAAADHLGIPVRQLGLCVSDNNSAEAMLLRSGRVSAMTVFVTRHRRVVFYNPDRSEGRIASDLSHELAHALLFHPSHAVSAIGNCDGISSDAEAEAAHLAGVLLISDQSALHIAERDIDTAMACEMYGVSEKMITYRMNVSAAKKRVARRWTLGIHKQAQIVVIGNEKLGRANQHELDGASTQ